MKKNSVHVSISVYFVEYCKTKSTLILFQLDALSIFVKKYTKNVMKNMKKGIVLEKKKELNHIYWWNWQQSSIKSNVVKKIYENKKYSYYLCSILLRFLLKNRRKKNNAFKRLFDFFVFILLLLFTKVILNSQFKSWTTRIY